MVSASSSRLTNERGRKYSRGAMYSGAKTTVIGSVTTSVNPSVADGVLAMGVEEEEGLVLAVDVVGLS